MARKKKSKIDKDPSVISANRALTKLLTSLKKTEDKIKNNYEEFKKMDKNLGADDSSLDKITITNLHDYHAIVNDKKITNPSNIIDEITRIRKSQYKEYDNLNKLNSEVERAKIDVLLAKIKCMTDQLDKDKDGTKV